MATNKSFNNIGFQTIKFIYSEKATNIWRNFSLSFDVAKPNLYGLIRIYEFYIPFFLLLQILFLLEASRYYFFENWLMKIKCPLLMKPLGTIIQKNISVLLPLKVIQFYSFNYKTPCMFRFICNMYVCYMVICILHQTGKIEKKTHH